MADKKVYRYPLTMIAETTDYLQIDIVEYVPILSNSGSFASKPGTRYVNNGTKRLETVLLPIPSNIQDGNAISTKSSNLNSIAGAALGGIIKTMEAGATLNLGEVGNQIRQGLADTANAGGGLTGAQGFVTRSLASKAIGILGANVTADEILARQQGEILNPNMELLFSGPTLRTFRFKFKMTPRNGDESLEVKRLIRCLKKNMAPKVKGTNIRNTPNDIGDNANNTTFLKTPNVFELRYRSGNGDHRFLHKFKQCFLESINVTYTADGTYATYSDGTPVSIVMDLTFKEIEPIYDIDYEGDQVSYTGPYAPEQDPGTVGY
jgi:hypothetical protein